MMKRIVAYIFFVFPFITMGQVSVVQKDTSKPVRLIIRDMPEKMDGPLYILDDSIVKKSQIDTSQIRNIEIIRGAEATALWGSRGINGVYIYTSESYAKQKAKHTILTKLVGNDALYIYDGMPFENLNNLNADSIVNVDVWKYPRDSPNVFFERPARSAIIFITTIKSAKKTYQAKLGEISEGYREYILRKDGDDSEVVYIVDKEQLKISSNTDLAYLNKVITTYKRNIKFEMLIDSKTGLFTVPKVTITTKK